MRVADVRYMVLSASVVIQVCIGGIYAWSSFVPALCGSYALSTAQTQAVFGVQIAVFTLSMVYSGRLLNRRDPKSVAGIGGLLFGLGYVGASLSGGVFPVLLLGIGVLAGAGTGFGYVCPLAVCVRWFPERKGLVTGVAVAGFGGGAILLSHLAEFLFARGEDVLTVFRYTGVSYGCLMAGAALLLRFPPAHEPMYARPVTLSVLLKDRHFWALFVGMFSGTFAGLLAIGNLKPMALTSGVSPAMAAKAISAFAVGNAGGRLVWGWIVDRIGIRAIPFSLAVLAVAVGGLIPAGIRVPCFTVVSMLIGFGFGACFVVYAAQAASRYGAHRLGNIYPIVFLAYGLAGISGPWIGGRLYDATATYSWSVAASLAVVLFGLVVSRGLLGSPAHTDLKRVGSTAPGGACEIRENDSGNGQRSGS